MLLHVLLNTVMIPSCMLLGNLEKPCDLISLVFYQNLGLNLNLKENFRFSHMNGKQMILLMGEALTSRWLSAPPPPLVPAFCAFRSNFLGPTQKSFSVLLYFSEE